MGKSGSEKKSILNNKKLYLILPIFLIPLIASLFYFSYFPIHTLSQQIVSPPTDDQSFHFHNTVCITKIDGITKQKTDIGCRSNNVTFIGLNLTRDFLSSFSTTGSKGNFTYIALCNATAGCGGSANSGAGMGFTNGSNAGGGVNSANVKEFVGNGLIRQAATYTLLPNFAGNYSLFTTFTSSGVAGLQINATGLFNQSTIQTGWNGTMFAVNTFSDVTLDGTAGDQLTVNWTVSVN